MKEVTLKTKRLILRKPRKADWRDVMEGAGEFDVAKMTKAIPYPYKKKDADWFINNALKKWREKTNCVFVIELKKEKKVIGALGLHGINKFAGTATTGSWINKKYWRQGYMTEAKIAVNDFSFSRLKLNRLNSSVATNNKASNVTQKKMGYKLEGKQRKSVRSKASGKIHDVYLYGLLREDWIKIRKKLIKKLRHPK